MTVKTIAGIPTGKSSPDSYAPPIRCTGYTKICGRCCHRFGEKPEMINKPRELEMVRCKKCETAEMSKWEKTLAGGLK